jgi:transcriptional regulator with XRE-family HTH domain
MTEAQARQLGRLFKRARKAKKLSLREVDEQSGVSYGWLSRLERGLTAAPSPTKLTRVARVLGISPERLDRITRGQVSSELPPIRTYFRAKYQLNTEEIQQIEEVFDRVRRGRSDIDEELDDIEEGRHG